MFSAGNHSYKGKVFPAVSFYSLGVGREDIGTRFNTGFFKLEPPSPAVPQDIR
jgi:hypothetical protein